MAVANAPNSTVAGHHSDAGLKLLPVITAIPPRMPAHAAQPIPIGARRRSSIDGAGVALKRLVEAARQPTADVAAATVAASMMKPIKRESLELFHVVEPIMNAAQVPSSTTSAPQMAIDSASASARSSRRR